MAAPVYQKEFIQDIRQDVRVRSCGGLMFTGDALADTIKVNMYDGADAYPISGTVDMNCIRADGATVPVPGSVSGNTAQATLTQACCAVQGPLSVVMKVTSGGVTSTILKAVYTVDLGETGTVVDPGTIIPDVAALISAIETAIGSIPADYSALLASIAETFSDSEAYSVGDYVWYNGQLYIFGAEHAAGSWVGTDARRVVLADDLTALDGDFKTFRQWTIPLYLSTGIYSVGDYVWYNNKAYRCISAIVTPEEFTPAHWESLEHVYFSTDINRRLVLLQGNIAETFSDSEAYSVGDYVWYNGQLYIFGAEHAAGSWVGTDARLVQTMGEIAENTADIAENTADIADLKSAVAEIDELGAENRLPNVNGTTTVGTVNFVSLNGVYTISGSSSGLGYLHDDIYRNNAAFPDGIAPGMKLQIMHICDDSNIEFRFYEYVNGTYSELANIAGNGVKNISISNSATGCIVRLSAQNGKTYSSVVSRPLITTTQTKQQIEKRLENVELPNDRYYPANLDNTYRLYIANAFVNKSFSSGSGISDSSIRAMHIGKLNDGTIVYFNKALYTGTYMIVDSATMTTLLVPNTGWNTTGEMLIDTAGLNDYTVLIQFKDSATGSGDVDVKDVSKNVTIFERNNIVDLFLFIGQSNMAGRGATSTTWPETAPSLYPCAGLEFRSITDQTRLYPIAEPFGYAENKTGGIDDGTGKTGGMVTAFVNAYWRKTGMQIVGVSASEGGTNISQWASGSDKLNDAIQRLTDAITYLNGKGYTIRHKYMLWCQGESDTRAEITPEQHRTYFDGIQAALFAAGIERCFMVRIGEYNGVEYDYTPIINVQTEIAQTDPDVVMATTILASYKYRNMMKDQWHYYQAAYNEMGRYAGINVAFYVNETKEPTMYDPKSNNLYYCHKN